MSSPLNVNDVVAVVSAYNPSDDLTENVRCLKSHVNRVIVVDDGSPQDVRNVLAAVEDLGVTVVRLAENSGIAAALNAGIKHARTLWNPEWVVTMDQDSRFDGDYINSALATARGSRDPNSVAMIAAQSHNGANLPVLRDAVEPEIFDPMQSGTLIRASTFDRVGYLNEELFIDCVDSEFNARVRNAGLRALAGVGCDLNHSLGHTRPLKVLGWRVRLNGRPISVHYHPPFRVYYITRNSIVMARKYFRKQPGWVLRRLNMELQSNIIRFVYGPERRKHGIAVFFGVRDAFASRMGRIDPDLSARLH